MKFHCEIGFGVRCLGKERILSTEHFVAVMPFKFANDRAACFAARETLFKLMVGSLFPIVYSVNTLYEKVFLRFTVLLAGLVIGLRSLRNW